MKILIKRITKGQKEILGELTFNDFKCKTLELPDLGNKSKVSCIPYGKYNCIKVEATHNIPYKHISILDVVNREGICIHKGNYYTQILGCVLVGDSYADINKDGIIDILNSGTTYDKLMKLLPDKFELEII